MTQRIVRIVAYCLTLAMLLVGCELKSLPNGLQGPAFDGVSQTIPLIVGTLVDGSGQPVEGAKVRAYVAPYRIEALSTEPAAAVEATTDAKGAFRLDSPPLGSVAVEARGRGLKALRTGVAVSNGATVELGTLSLQPTGRISGKVTTPGGVSLLGTDVFIPGTDYLAKAAADGSYSIQDVPVGTYQLAAVRPNFQPRVIEGVSVLAGQTTTPEDLALSLDAPVLTSIHPLNGGAGTIVTLRGTNFGESKQSTLQVTFGDTVATTVRRVSDTEIQATVPVGALSGPIVVRSNGIASGPKTFMVIASLNLTPASLMLSPSSSQTISLRALDSLGEGIPDPFVAWALRDPEIGTVSAQGTFTAMGLGVTEVTARTGILSQFSWAGASPYRATTEYGSGRNENAGDGGSARLASFRNPFSMALDAAGNLYVACGSTTIIRRIAPDGTVTRFAGNGLDNASGDGGPALDAGLGVYAPIAVDAQNRLWIADAGHHVVRFIPLDDRSAPTYRAGYIYRAAGTGTAGYSEDGTMGPEARLNWPQRLSPAPEGVYIIEKGNHRIRLIDQDLRLRDVLGTGNPTQLTAPMPQAAAPIASPFDCALDEHGNMLIGTEYQVLFWCRVNGRYLGQDMAAGMVYPIATVNRQKSFRGDGPGWQDALHATPMGLHPDGQGGFWLIDDMLVRRLTSEGRIETLAGKPSEQASLRAFGPDGEGANALKYSLANPTDLLTVAGGLLVVDGSYYRIVRLSESGP